MGKKEEEEKMIEYGVHHRLTTISKIMDLKGINVIDIGCGSGRYSAIVAKLGVQYVIGIEINHKRLKDAKDRFGKICNIYFICASAEKLPIKNQTLNLTLMIDVIEHVNNQHKTLNEANRILKSNGKIFIGAPNKFYPFDLHGMTILGVHVNNVLGIPFLSWLPHSIRQLVKCKRVYSQKDLVYLLKEHGFLTVLIDYMMPPLESVKCSINLKYAIRRTFKILENLFLLKYIGSSIMVFGEKKTN